MLRRIYFLSLLLCIRSIFCYDRIPDGNRNLKFIHRKYRNGIRRQFEDITKKYEGDSDKESAHIDVASFIQNPDQLENDQLYQDSNEFREDVQNEYGSIKNNYGTIDENSLNELSKYNQAVDVDSIHTKEHDLNVGDLLIDQSDSRNANVKLPYAKATYSIDQNLDHYPAKKCVLKNMKIPFFSHKSKSPKPKQNRKRKLFHFHKFRKGTKNIASVTESTLVSRNLVDTTMEHRKLVKKKRSYYEMLCPACKQRFIKKVDQHKRLDADADIVHNSRQNYSFTNNNNIDNYDILKAKSMMEDRKDFELKNFEN